MKLSLLEEDGKAIRDPIWGYIYTPDEILELVDTEDFQRLRNISQLGHVYLVYPGARHSRFEHSLGVFHLTKRFLLKLLQSDPPLELEEEDIKVCLAAALLHDVGHYPFSHILEEMQMSFIPHEERARRIIQDEQGEIYRVLERTLGVDPARVANVIDYENRSLDIPPRDLLLANILSGTLDPDKIDYLLRDARLCGVPFGESVNKDRLIGAIKYDPVRRRLAITRKGICAIEALIFTNYLMYRNVYWHKAVRSASAMFKRALQDLLLNPNCKLKSEDFQRITEAEMRRMLDEEMGKLKMDRTRELLRRTFTRKLYKVARTFYPHERNQAFVHHFYDLYYRPERRRQKEIELCRIFAQKTGLDLSGDEILIDIPSFGKSLEVELKVFCGAEVPEGKDDPLSFDDPEVSRLKEYLIDNFESHAKIFRIFCIDNSMLKETIKGDVKRYMD